MDIKAAELIDQVLEGENPTDVISDLCEAPDKKLLMKVFRGFKKVGDAKKIGGKHKVIDASKGFKSYVLDDMSDEDLKKLAKEKGIRV